MGDKNINQIFGIYKVLEQTNNPDHNKGRWYKVKCTVCNKEFIKSWETIKKCTKNCQHEEKIEHNCQCCGKKLIIRRKETIKEFNKRKFDKGV